MTNSRLFTGDAWWNPASGMEAAMRWNLMAVEWMTRGWRQWMELATALADPVTPDALVPAPVVKAARTPLVKLPRRSARPLEHAAAKSAAKRAATKRPARPQAAAPRSRPHG